MYYITSHNKYMHLMIVQQISFDSLRRCLSQNAAILDMASDKMCAGGQITKRAVPGMVKHFPGKIIKFSSSSNFLVKSSSSSIEPSSAEKSMEIMAYMAPFGRAIFSAGHCSDSS
jgi:hypothetical protein